MNASVEARRDDLRDKLPRDLMRLTGHLDHPYELEAILELDGEGLKGDPHHQLVVVWCVANTCKLHTSRGTAVGPTHVCMLTRCTLCHPITWWEKAISTIRVVFG